MFPAPPVVLIQAETVKSFPPSHELEPEKYLAPLLNVKFFGGIFTKSVEEAPPPIETLWPSPERSFQFVPVPLYEFGLLASR